jgi:glycosyltransferase involved in cell wall biosynthesis
MYALNIQTHLIYENRAGIREIAKAGKPFPRGLSLMKVALVSNSYDSASGEIVFFKSMEDALEQEGIETEICSVPTPSPETILGRINSCLRFPAWAGTRLRVGRIRDADVLHLLNASLAPAFIGEKRFRKIATVTHSQQTYLSLSPPANALSRLAESSYLASMRPFERSAFSSFDRITTPNVFQSRSLSEHFSLPGAAVKTIPLGVDVKKYSGIQKEDLKSALGVDYIILFVGRLHERYKGISYLLKAVSGLNDLSFRLLVAGDGPERGYYESLVRSLGLSGKVSFLGQIGRAHV